MEEFNPTEYSLKNLKDYSEELKKGEGLSDVARNIITMGLNYTNRSALFLWKVLNEWWYSEERLEIIPAVGNQNIKGLRERFDEKVSASVISWKEKSNLHETNVPHRLDQYMTLGLLFRKPWKGQFLWRFDQRIVELEGDGFARFRDGNAFLKGGFQEKNKLMPGEY